MDGRKATIETHEAATAPRGSAFSLGAPKEEAVAEL